MNSKMVQFVSETDRNSSLVLLRLKSDNVWITGGTFGIEAALPVVVLYILTIGWLVNRKPGFMKHDKTKTYE